MFNHLIESSSHIREYKRRGSFLLFTSVVYVVLFAVSGVVAIYAYDAKLEKQSLEIVTLLPPQEIFPDEPPAVEQPPDRPRVTTGRDDRIPVREIAMADVDRPELVPDPVSTGPNKNLSLPKSGQFKFGDRDFNPEPGDGGTGTSTRVGRQVVRPAPAVEIPDIPPPPDPPKQPKIISKGPITGSAIYLPKPVYSELAKRMRAEGAVRVQVVVGLDGRVESATVLNGSPFLRAEAQKAAMQARFAPTTLNDQPVKVSGVIIYNFQLQ